jgi:hypothetical protein
MVRYFEAPAEEQKQTRFVCKRCGAESEHRTKECPVLVVRVASHSLIPVSDLCVVFDLWSPR